MKKSKLSRTRKTVGTVKGPQRGREENPGC